MCRASRRSHQTAESIIDFDFGDVIWKEFFRVERVPSPGIRVTGGFAFDEIGEIRNRHALADELTGGLIEKDLHVDAIAVAVDKVVSVTVLVSFVAAIAEERIIKIESFSVSMSVRLLYM